MALPLDILRDLKDLARRVSNLETTPQPPNIKLSETSSAIFDIDVSGGPGDIVLITVELTDTQGGRLVGTPHFSFFRDNTQDAAHQWPLGSEWADDQIRGLKIHSWLDWGETDNTNVILKILLVNQVYLTSFTDMLFKVNWRYLSREVSVT